MNAKHLELCGGAEWAETVKSTIIPWVLKDADLGDDTLEVGPGPGSTTSILRSLTPRLTAIEVDAELAASLAARLAGTNVEVIHGDATALTFPDGRFSAAVCFTMLHHVPSIELQDRLLGELARVMRPGALLAGLDSLDSEPFRDLHVDDICVPLDPATLGGRLERAGFREVEIETNPYAVRFRAKR